MMTLIYTLIVGSAAIGCLINGQPTNAGAAAIFALGIYAMVWDRR